MQLDVAAGHSAATRRGDDTARQARVTLISRPAREDHRTEAAPLKSERLFQMAFERAVIGIAHVSPQGRWLRFNRRLCDFLGYDRAELAARTFQDVTHPDDFEPCRAYFQRLLTGEIDEYAMDKRYIRKDGAPVWAHIAVSLVRTPEGAPDFTVTMIQDINERKQLEQERETARANELATREVNQRMEQFLATAAHDLRQPVTGAVVCIGLAQRCLQRLAATTAPLPPSGDQPAGRCDDVLNALERAGQAVNRLSRLTVRLFDVAQAQTGALGLKREPCDLVALVREQVEMHRLEMADRTLRLDLRAKRSVPVLADGDRLGQVLTNYLINALKYSPPDRPVAVSLVVRQRQARVAVRDEGPGLPPEEQARVWEPFHRAPGIAVQSAVGESLGLGLHICKTIIEAHGGLVGIESEVGTGSTFWFTLPLASAQ
jgi:PAS domain S-box-containing protein